MRRSSRHHTKDRSFGVGKFFIAAHPTWWHVRDYGLFAANPFGQHDFEKKAKGVGELKLKAGEAVTFRYRFYFHESATEAVDLNARYDEYVAGK